MLGQIRRFSNRPWLVILLFRTNSNNLANLFGGAGKGNLPVPLGLFIGKAERVDVHLKLNNFNLETFKIEEFKISNIEIFQIESLIVKQLYFRGLKNVLKLNNF